MIIIKKKRTYCIMDFDVQVDHILKNKNKTEKETSI